MNEMNMNEMEWCHYFIIVCEDFFLYIKFNSVKIIELKRVKWNRPSVY